MLGAPVGQELFQRQVLLAAHKIEPMNHDFLRDKLELIAHTDAGGEAIGIGRLARQRLVGLAQ